MFADKLLSQLDIARQNQSLAADAEALDPTAPRIAIYDDSRAPPRIVSIEETAIPDLIDAIAAQTHELARERGGRLPYEVLRELVENLLHAGFADVVITILDKGNTIRISDRGPGIADKESAIRPGFTTAGQAVKSFVRGVGSGLPLARESLSSLRGRLEIEDNLGGGTVVTIRVPPAESARPPVYPLPPHRTLPDRQLRVLLVCVELGSVGPSRVAQDARHVRVYRLPRPARA